MTDRRTLWERITGVPASDNPAYRRGRTERERFLRSDTPVPFGRSTYADVAPMPPLRAGRTGNPRVDVSGAVDPRSPAAFGDFASYANDAMDLTTEGVGGPAPVSMAHDIIPNAGLPTWQQENEAAMREAMRRGEDAAEQIGIPYDIYPGLEAQDEVIARMRRINEAAQRERRRREAMSFEDWRRSPDRLEFELTHGPEQPAYSHQGQRR